MSILKSKHTAGIFGHTETFKEENTEETQTFKRVFFNTDSLLCMDYNLEDIKSGLKFLWKEEFGVSS